MATRNNPREPGELVQELDSVFERAAEWVGQRPQVAIAVIAAILAAAALAGGLHAWRERAAHAAEAEVAAAWDGYLTAMGASPGARDVPVPANPEVGRKARAEFAAKLLAAADAHDGSAAAALGRLQAADLLEQNGDADGALAARERAAKAAPRTGIAAIALSRYAVALESKGDLEGAARAFAEAAEIDSPGRVLALADAARCFAALGQRERALALFEQAEKLSPGDIPAHIRERLAELKHASGPVHE